jgi:hypothetical protein
MSAEELETATALAKQADAGNASAAATLRSLAEKVIRRREKEKDGES